MASICNPILRPPTAMSTIPISDGVIRRTATLTLRTPLPVLTPKTLARPPKAISSEKNINADAIPEFAADEIQKFKAYLVKRLSKANDHFREDLDTVVDICAEIFDDYLHEDYEGPGTLTNEPFDHIFFTLREKYLPGPPTVARVGWEWAQVHLDRDWEDWKSKSQQ